jgi:hypothetical protein
MKFSRHHLDQHVRVGAIRIRKRLPLPHNLADLLSESLFRRHGDVSLNVSGRRLRELRAMRPLTVVVHLVKPVGAGGNFDGLGRDAELKWTKHAGQIGGKAEIASQRHIGRKRPRSSGAGGRNVGAVLRAHPMFAEANGAIFSRMFQSAVCRRRYVSEPGDG